MVYNYQYQLSFLSPSPAKPLVIGHFRLKACFGSVPKKMPGSGSLPEKVDAESRQMNLRHTFCKDGTQVDNKKSWTSFKGSFFKNTLIFAGVFNVGP